MTKIQQIIRQYWPYLLLIILGLLVYASSLGNEFVWDDEEQIVLNQAVHSLNNWGEFFKSSTFNAGGGAKAGGLYYKPLMTLSYAWLYTLSSGRASWFHAFQVILHLTNSCLLLSLFYWLIKNKYWPWPEKANNQLKTILPWFLAAVWLLHPINVESVAYIASLQDVQSFTWGMLALHFSLRAPMRWWRYLLTGLLLLAAVLSKETGALFIPLVWLGTTLWPNLAKSSTPSSAESPKKSSSRQLRLAKESELIYGGLLSFVIVLFYTWLRFGYAQLGLQSHGLSPITRISLLERLMSVPKIIWFYLRTFIWPDQLTIAQHWHVESLSLTEFWLPLITVLLLAVIFAWLTYQQISKKNWVWLFFIVWFGLGMGLHLQIFPLDMTVADRWFYFPMAGLLGMLGVWLTPWISTQLTTWKNYALVIGAIVVLALLGARSWMRIQNWQDSLSLYSQDIQANPDAFDLSNNYGVALFRAGDDQAALNAFKHSVEVAPHWWTNWNNYGVLLEQQGATESAQQAYAKAVENGEYYLAYENLAKILLQSSPESAREFTESALEKLPYNYTLWFVYLSSLNELGETELALPYAKTLAEQTRVKEFIELYQSMLETP